MGAIYVALLTVKDRLTADREKGATAVEYGLLVGLIAVAIIATLVLLGPKLNGMFETVLNEMPATNAPASTTT